MDIVIFIISVSSTPFLDIPTPLQFSLWSESTVVWLLYRDIILSSQFLVPLVSLLSSFPIRWFVHFILSIRISYLLYRICHFWFLFVICVPLTCLLVFVQYVYNAGSLTNISVLKMSVIFINISALFLNLSVIKTITNVLIFIN